MVDDYESRVEYDPTEGVLGRGCHGSTVARQRLSCGFQLELGPRIPDYADLARPLGIRSMSDEEREILFRSAGSSYSGACSDRPGLEARWSYDFDFRCGFTCG
jgi:hypothetical protein